MEARKIYQQLMIFYLVFFLIIVLLSLLFVRIIPRGALNRYDPTTFNLISYVPLSLWIAISALAVLMIFLHLSNPKWLSSKSEYRLMFVISLVILIVFHGLPQIVEPNPRIVDSFAHGRTAKPIIENGILQPIEFTYQAYPSSFIFLSVFSIMTGMDLTLSLKIIPVIFLVLWFFYLALFVDKLLKNLKLATISVLTYGLSTYYLAFHFSPEIVGWLFLVLLLYFIAREIDKNARCRKNLVIVTVLLIGIATTHAVTQLLTVLVMLLLLAFGKKIWMTKFEARKMFGPLLLAITLFSAWNSFSSSPYFFSVVDGFIRAFRIVLSDFMSSVSAQRFQANFPPEVANLLVYRQVLYLTILLTSIFGSYLFWKQKKRSGRAQFNFLLGLLIAALVAAPLTIFGILPLERTIKLAFIPLSMYSAYLIFERKRIGALILVFLLLTIPVNFASLYWDEIGRNMTHDWEISSAKFIGANFHGIILGDTKETGIQIFYGNFDKVYNDFYIVGRRPNLLNLFNYSFIKEKDIELVYITQLTIQSMKTQSGMDLDMDLLLNSPFLDRVHSNEYSVILIRKPDS